MLLPKKIVIYALSLLSGITLHGEQIWHPELKNYTANAINDLQRYEVEQRWYVHDYNITLRQGESNPRVGAIKTQLVLEGDISPQRLDNRYSDRFDIVLTNGLKAYQKRHGLKATGVLDGPTRRELSVTLSQRIALLKLNKERISNIHSSRGGWIIVNIPTATFDLMENNETLISMKTVVGKPDRQTPLFDRRIVYSVVLNPTWTMPETVIREDMTKKISHNPDMFSDKNISVFRGKRLIDPKTVDWKSLNPQELMGYKYVQNSGAENPLGKVKFLFLQKQMNG